VQWTSWKERTKGVEDCKSKRKRRKRKDINPRKRLLSLLTHGEPK